MKLETKGRPTWASIDLKALKWNFHQVRRLVGKQIGIISVVKANAYGHGAIECAKRLAEYGSQALGVATVEEGKTLRQAGIGLPIIVFGVIQPYELKEVISWQLQPTLVDSYQVRSIAKLIPQNKTQLKVHLKIDTGMGRIGINPTKVQEYIKLLLKNPKLKLQGIFTHFATADGKNKAIVKQQLDKLQQVTDKFRQAGFDTFITHAANSAAIIKFPQAYQDSVRPGIMLYGLYPATGLYKRLKLKPVLSWYTKIVQIKEVPKGVGLSYGHTFITKRASKIATLPIGYADGLSRLLSNRGKVLLQGQVCPIVGRVCMDMCLVDVTKVRTAQVGNEVVLLGQQGKKEITADNMAKILNTISYEIVCAISNRVPRIFKG